MLKKIHTLVKGGGHLVLATCAGGRPHASLMAFCASPEAPGPGGEIWLATLRQTRKYSNLLENPRASLLVDDRGAPRPGSEEESGPQLALTIEAELRPFADEARLALARAALLARHPALAGLLALPGAQVLALCPLRYQLLAGLTETFVWEPEKNLDAPAPIE